MTTYCIGDIHGCFDEFQFLLNEVKFNPEKDLLITTGDVIGRGPKPIETLNFLNNHRNSIISVLGNHDLSLLNKYSTWLKCNSSEKKNEYLKQVKAPELSLILMESNGVELLEYLRYCPMFYYDQSKKLLVTHAGISPEWGVNDVVENGRQVEHLLRSENFHFLMDRIYSDSQNKWSPIKKRIHSKLKDCSHLFDFDEGQYDLMKISPSLEADRCIYTINTLTRMRYCTANGSLDFACKDNPRTHVSNKIKPWYELKNIKIDKNLTLVFGHWAALEGKDPSDNIIALDTGCVWNGALTMINIETPKIRFTVKAFH